MKEINIFLASSINEFKNERNAVGDFIRKLQDKLLDHDIYIDLFECEFHENTMAHKQRMQELYNEKIKASKIFLMFIGEKLGEFTLEEYNVAVTIPKLKKVIVFYGKSQTEAVLSFKKSIKPNQNLNIYEAFNNADLFEIIKEKIEETLENKYTITLIDNKITIKSSLE